jgi:hypothetical protein
MKCPHCAIHFHDNWDTRYMERASGIPQSGGAYWYYRSALCPNCRDVTIEVALMIDKAPVSGWRQIYPIGASRGPVPPEVPAEIAQDYIESCNVLPISAKASAALSRRCLQNILHAHGYKGTSATFRPTPSTIKRLFRSSKLNLMSPTGVSRYSKICSNTFMLVPQWLRR